jgi:hypothetical protein
MAGYQWSSTDIGRYYVSVVLRYCLSANALYTPGHLVDCRCDRPIESYVVHPTCVGLVEPGLDGGEDCFRSSLVDVLYVWIR